MVVKIFVATFLSFLCLHRFLLPVFISLYGYEL